MSQILKIKEDKIVCINGDDYFRDIEIAKLGTLIDLDIIEELLNEILNGVGIQTLEGKLSESFLRKIDVRVNTIKQMLNIGLP